MGLPRWARIVLASLAGYLPTACGEMHLDNEGEEVSISSWSFPRLSDLEEELSMGIQNRQQLTGIYGKQHLLELADRIDRYHASMSLFLGSYTLGADSDFAFAIEHRDRDEYDTPELGVWRLAHNAAGIKGHLANRTSTYTMTRVAAAEELHAILIAAKNAGYLRDAAYVLGYLDRATIMTAQAASTFSFFYRHDEEDIGPEVIWRNDRRRREEIVELRRIAASSFTRLPEDIKEKLTDWIGQYGHKALESTTETRWEFEDNEVARVTTGRVLTDFPSARRQDQETFYRDFGRQLVQVYGL